MAMKQPKCKALEPLAKIRWQPQERAIVVEGPASWGRSPAHAYIAGLPFLSLARCWARNLATLGAITTWQYGCPWLRKKYS